MNSLKHSFLQALKLLLFWILVFDFQRILFSIHHWESFNTVSWGDWFLTFVYSFRLDLATGAFLSILPLITLALCFVKPAKWTYRIFVVTMMTEVVLVSFIHSGEINAYTEWKHKLTSRVFMHLSNPDEMFRSADYSMTIWFFIYSILEVVFGWRMLRWLFKAQAPQTRLKIGYRVPVAIVGMSVFMIPFIILGRGGFQQIPINIDSAYFSNNHLANDLAVNSTYFFGNSYALYNKIDIAASLPKIDMDEANELVTQLYDYPREHDVRILDNKSPNIVMIIMESWSAEAIGCLSETKGATNHFDKLASEGVLFTNIYATGTRSEIGNSSIFGGMLAIPGLSISARPEKHRKLPTLNQDLATSGYSSHYIFSGDLKYGNIGGYFMDHGFDDVTDENGFPSNIERGKLNFYDEDLYRQLLIRINATQGKLCIVASLEARILLSINQKRKTKHGQALKHPL